MVLFAASGLVGDAVGADTAAVFRIRPWFPCGAVSLYVSLVVESPFPRGPWNVAHEHERQITVSLLSFPVHASS
jgi:hypothetical protein